MIEKTIKPINYLGDFHPTPTNLGDAIIVIDENQNCLFHGISDEILFKGNFITIKTEE